MSSGGPDIRPISDDDLEAVIALDRRVTGQSRRGFYQKHLAAGHRTPEAFVWLVAGPPQALAGFVSAHILNGEFGGTAPVAVLDALVSAPEVRGQGLGHALITALESELKARGVWEVHTQADWQEHDLVQFFAANGFSLAPNLVLECGTPSSL